MISISYPSARPWIEDGDLICFQGKWQVSHLITKGQWLSRMLGRSRHDIEAEGFSHTGVAFWASTQFGGSRQRLYVVEFCQPMGRVMPLSALVHNYRAVGGQVCWRELNPDSGLDGWRIAKAAHDLVGKRYARWHWLQYAAAWLGWEKDFDAEGYTCSEGTATALAAAGLNIYAPSTKPADVISLPVWRKGIHALQDPSAYLK